MSSNEVAIDVHDYINDEEFESLCSQSPHPFSPAYIKALKQAAHEQRQREQRYQREGPRLIAAEIHTLSLRDIEVALSKAKTPESRTRLKVLLVMKKIELKRKALEEELIYDIGGKNYKPSYRNMGGRHMRKRRNGRFAR